MAIGVKQLFQNLKSYIFEWIFNFKFKWVCKLIFLKWYELQLQVVLYYKAHMCKT
jgi:hypothetical protein